MHLYDMDELYCIMKTLSFFKKEDSLFPLFRTRKDVKYWISNALVCIYNIYMIYEYMLAAVHRTMLVSAKAVKHWTSIDVELIVDRSEVVTTAYFTLKTRLDVSLLSVNVKLKSLMILHRA